MKFLNKRKDFAIDARMINKMTKLTEKFREYIGRARENPDNLAVLAGTLGIMGSVLLWDYAVNSTYESQIPELRNQLKEAMDTNNDGYISDAEKDAFYRGLNKKQGEKITIEDAVRYLVGKGQVPRIVPVTSIFG